jgi:hypothetical protein
VYNRFGNRPLLLGAYNVIFTLIDRGLLELVGPFGGGKVTNSIGRALASVQTGRVYDYAQFIILFTFIGAYGIAASTIWGLL